MLNRGRPAGQMTHRRRQVLSEYRAMAERGERIRLAELARRCGIADYRNAKRIMREMRELALI